MLKAIEKALAVSDIGITPSNDGKVIRLVFPQLTEERRIELTKTVKKHGDEAKIAVRNIRRDAVDDYKVMKKNSEITEDDLADTEEDIQKLTDGYIVEIEKLVAKKDKEILEV
jgi:ribosome recycling factor